MTAPLRLVAKVEELAAKSCSVPRDDHEGEVHLYPAGWRCDAHAPGPAIRYAPLRLVTGDTGTETAA